METSREEVVLIRPKSHPFVKGVAAAVPIMIGYLPIGITFGLLAKQAGLTLYELTAMSAFVFAGASQFMAANMIAVGIGVVEIIVATFILNFRHFIMSLSLMNALKVIPFQFKLSMSFGLTDETFALSSMNAEKANEEKSHFFYGGLILASYLTWVFGSFLGGLVGEFIPQALSQSMTIALYVMFIALLVPSVKKEWRFGIIAFISMIFNYGFSQFLTSGWSIVLATLLGGCSGIFLMRGEEK
ncbi:AzlC family ABC transporter permease [Metabacillus iocasae]|uniref:4-azaleucine resistance transporter AzlC n=1 Tax=Priestia iocasae TaxID=2291674 RepID=A0ABS2QVD2_9BACI|nr:AzlC family ABC transporter permease [Metabacillus iocasae]MBM7703440.1 4-azaleucine resistance transporter AzlC [Metabacillus iocasae]